MTELRSNPTLDGNRPVTTGTGRWYLALLAAGAALFGTLLYLNALNNPFVYDDYRLIVENPTIQDLSNLKAIVLRDITRPVVNVTYAVDTAVWGTSPFGYHLTNIVLHAINVMLVFSVALMACEDRQRQRNQFLDAAVSAPLAAFATALLFAIHPMMTQAVGYITGRSEVAFACLFLIAFLAGRHWMLLGGRRWWIACVSVWAVAVLTKESAAMLPFVLMAYDWLVLDAPAAEKRRRLFAMGLPLVLVTVVAGLGRIAVLQYVEYQHVVFDGRYSLVAADAFWRYLGLLTVPRDQAIFHTMEMPNQAAPLRMVAGAVGILALPFAAWALRRIQSAMAFGGVWFLLMLAPSSILFALGVGEPLAEHRAYVPAAGLFLVWGCAFDLLWQRTSGRRALRIVVAMTAVLFVVQLSLRTLERNLIWGDPVLLARESVELAPEHWFPRLLLGEAYRQVGRCDEAIPVYRQVLEMRPKEEKTYIKLAGCLIQEKRLDEAETSMQELRAVNPTSQEATMSLGVLAMLKNDLDRARTYFTETVEQHPELEDAPRMLAFVNGALPSGEHRQLCDDLNGMVASFDVAACVARKR